jgi:thiol-disulfide isomerase/thioredoxin
VSNRRAIPVAVILLALSACAPTAPAVPEAEKTTALESVAASPSAATPSTSASARTPGPAVTKVPAALRFTSTTVDGKRFEGSSLAGKPVLLWFWAPWCPVCRGQIPQVEKIADDHKGSLSIVGVGSLDSAGAIRGFAQDVSGVTQLVDESGAVWKHFRVKEQSSFVLLDASGEEVFSSGYGGTDELEQRVADVVR